MFAHGVFRSTGRRREIRFRPLLWDADNDMPRADVLEGI
jgi:hypothetical protein